jgi:farnesyl-diphosphate farnesyltransferase
MSSTPEIDVEPAPPSSVDEAAPDPAGYLAEPATAASEAATAELARTASPASSPAPPATVEPHACSPAEIDDLLAKTSRTFALAIPLLPEPTRLQVGIAYLLFRIADTFEDAELWPRARKLAALDRFERLLRRPDPEEARRAAERWLADPPCRHAGYLELLARSPAVLGAFWRQPEAARQLIGDHTRRTVEGMAGFVRRADERGELQLADLEDLEGYCYVVAGIVGELLTELFLLGRRSLAPVRAFLSERSARFGEALQLVNIVKDALADAAHGRRFLPPAADLGEVVALARRDLQEATRYTLSLQRAGAPRGIVAFVALPVRLAQATLDLVEQRGPGAKLSRPDVARIAEALNQALAQGLPAV